MNKYSELESSIKSLIKTELDDLCERIYMMQAVHGIKLSDIIKSLEEIHEENQNDKQKAR